MLQKGLRLFLADIIEEDTDRQIFWYVAGRTYESAFKRFTAEANKCWYSYRYYFYEVDDDEEIQEFIERHSDIRADIYETWF